MMDDAELLRRYVDSRSEIDFTVLVERHLNLVYQAALRRMRGRSDLAQDVTQQVFTTLVREAPKLVTHPSLVGWLFTATRHAASHLLRTERRREEREREAVVRHSLENSGAEANWDQIRGQLDEVMDNLAEQDRTAILMRFFHNQAFAQIGSAFGLSEDAARKRVERALERLRSLLSKRGITSTSAALGILLSSQAATAAPVGLAQTIASTALIPGATASLPTSSLLYFMNTKIALSIAGALGLAGLLSLPPVGLAIHESHEATRTETIAMTARQENERRQANLDKLQGQVREADQKTAGLKAELDRMLASATALTKALPSTSSPQSKAEADALADGKEFIARFPQVRQMLIDLGRAQYHAAHTSFYRLANLSPAQIDEFETKTSEFWLQSQTVTPNSIRPLVVQLPDDQLKQILGEENFQTFQDFNRAKSAYWLTGFVELAVGFSTSPLSQQQSTKLFQTITGNSNDYQNGQSLKIENVDWASVVTQAQKILTPEQWNAAQPAFLSAQLQNAVEKAQQTTTAIAKPKS
jgi:RNA polymerase sigma factor (sigma-70 family)